MTYHRIVADRFSPRVLVAAILGAGLVVAAAGSAALLWRRVGGPAADDLAASAPAAPVLSERPATEDPRLLAARTRHDAGDLDAAAALYEALCADRPDDDAAAHEYAYVLVAQAERLVEIGSFDAAAPLAERAVALAPGDTQISGFLVDLAAGRAEAYVRANRSDLALAALERAASLVPEDARVHAYLGKSYYEAEDLPRARHHLERSRTLDPRSPLSQGVAALLQRVGVEADASAGFHAADAGRYVIRFEGYASPEVGTRLRRTLADAEGRVRDRIGFGPSPPLVVLCYSAETFRGTWDLPDWAGGVYDGKIRIPLSAVEEGGERLEGVLLHELGHAAVAATAQGPVPVWLHEGIAQWAEHGGVDPYGRAVAGRALAEGSWVPVARLQTSFLGMGPDVAAIAYAEAAVAVGWLVDRHGRQGLEALVRAAGRTGDFDAALRESLQIDAADLDAGVRASLEG